jgi:hypothetical protein
MVRKANEASNNTRNDLGLIWPVLNVKGCYINTSKRIHTAAFLKVSSKEALLDVDFQSNGMKPVHYLLRIFGMHDDIIAVHPNKPRSSP